MCFRAWLLFTGVSTRQAPDEGSGDGGGGGGGGGRGLKVLCGSLASKGHIGNIDQMRAEVGETEGRCALSSH